jgi:hypothetical protein
LRPAIRKVAVPIDLDYQPLARAIKVGDVMAQGFLPRELDRQGTQELVPELALGWAWIASERL